MREELTQEKGVPVVRARSFCLNELAMLGISGPIFADQAAERPRPGAPAMRSRHLFPYLNWHLLSDPVHHPTNEKASTVTFPGEPSLTSLSLSIETVALATQRGEGFCWSWESDPGWDRISRWQREGARLGCLEREEAAPQRI